MPGLRTDGQEANIKSSQMIMKLVLLWAVALSLGCEAAPVAEHMIVGMESLFDTISETGATLMNAGDIASLSVRSYTCAEQLNKVRMVDNWNKHYARPNTQRT